MKTELQIRNELIQKLENYMQKSKFSVSVTLADITDYKINNGVHTCRIKCPFCEKRYLVNYTTYWAASNTLAHLKNHLTEITSETIANKQLNHTSSSAPNSSSGTVAFNTISPETVYLLCFFYFKKVAICSVSWPLF